MRDSYAVEVRKHQPLETFPGKIYELKKERVQGEGATAHLDVDSFDIGYRLSGGGHPQKVLLVVGETGTGKTTLLDGIANAYYRVKFEDDFRFKLVNESSHQGERSGSQTQKISVYKLYPLHGNAEEGSALDFPLVLIDTPGFGDTRGLQQDELIVKQISDVLSGNAEVPFLTGILHGIGFVVKASQNRLTHAQKYIFDQVLSLFGNDTEDILMPLITFGDQNEPTVLSALETDKIPGDHRLFVINNGMLYADNRSEDKIDKSKMERVEQMELNLRLKQTDIQWQTAELAYARMFDVLAKRPNEGVSLQMTRTVLKDRAVLRDATEEAHRRMQQAHINLSTIMKNVEFIRTLNEAITHSALHMKQTVTEPHVEREDVPDGKKTTMCIPCNKTCHELCRAGDAIKFLCSKMKRGKCTICKCSWSTHKNSGVIFRVTEKQKEVTVEELFKKHQVDSHDKEGKKKLISKMLREFEEIRKSMANDIATIHRCLLSLEQNALRQYPLSVTEYVDTLIHSEEKQRRPGWEVRVEQLEQARHYAEIISRARDGAANPLDDEIQDLLIAELTSEDFEVLADEIIDADGGRLSFGKIGAKISEISAAAAHKVTGSIMSQTAMEH